MRCVPPENKPTADEIATCRDFLTPTSPTCRASRSSSRSAASPMTASSRALGAQPVTAAVRPWRPHHVGTLTLFDSYHCSRYNTNTGVLTPDMFRAVFRAVSEILDADVPPSAAYDMNSNSEPSGSRK